MCFYILHKISLISEYLQAFIGPVTLLRLKREFKTRPDLIQMKKKTGSSRFLALELADQDQDQDQF